jgi:hypothetical protein
VFVKFCKVEVLSFYGYFFIAKFHNSNPKFSHSFKKLGMEKKEFDWEKKNNSEIPGSETHLGHTRPSTAFSKNIFFLAKKILQRVSLKRNLLMGVWF